MLNGKLATVQDEGEEFGTPFYLRIADPAAETENDALAAIAASDLHDRLARLSEREAIVLRWRYGLAGGEQLSIREVAARLKVAVSTAHAIERRAIVALRAAYEVAG